MFKCKICPFEATTQGQLAGHCSGHVRRGETIRKCDIVVEHRCKICGRVFETGVALGGHTWIHRIPFESVKNTGTLRNRLVIERGHQCEVCKLTEWCGKPIPIELDHIDGNPENNVRENLRLICPNCHAQTDTYKGRNIGRVTNTKRQQTLKKHYGKYR